MKTNIKNKKTHQRAVRHTRVRAKIAGTSERPRLAVFRSNRFMYAQLIDDVSGITLASARGAENMSLMEQAKAVGSAIAKAAKGKGINAAVFDRGGFQYAGRVKALAESAHEGGLVF